MRKSAFRALCAVLPFALASCDKAVRDELKEERSESLYVAAMDEYNAGRMEAAAEGFASALKANPANTSARFHLAVIQHDILKDYLGAICNYREYVSLAPDGEKRRLARDRMAGCEKLLASDFAEKYNLGDAAALKTEIADLKKSLEESKAAREAADRAAADSAGRIKTLEREIAQLRAVLKRMGDGEEESGSPRAVAAASEASAGETGARTAFPSALAAETPDEASAARPQAPSAPSDEDDGELGVNPEALRLFEEEERAAAAEEAAGPAGPATLPPQPPAAQAGDDQRERRGLADPVRRFGDPVPGRGAARDGAAATAGLRTHVVQEGETLSMIALKYYGRKQAWKRIKDANKTIVTSDGNVKAGETLVIP